MATYIISEHAKQRYSERIMDKDTKNEILLSSVTNVDKIAEDINTMIEHGEELYTGKSLSEYNNNEVTVILCNTWVIILDKRANKVVTLYKIDLGLGEEFNKAYVQRLLDKFREEEAAVNKLKETNLDKEIEYTDIIEQNEKDIADYKKAIKSLEDVTASYRTLIKELKTSEELATNGMRKVLGTMVGRKAF